MKVFHIEGQGSRSFTSDNNTNVEASMLSHGKGFRNEASSSSSPAESARALSPHLNVKFGDWKFACFLLRYYTTPHQNTREVAYNIFTGLVFTFRPFLFIFSHDFVVQFPNGRNPIPERFPNFLGMAAHVQNQ